MSEPRTRQMSGWDVAGIGLLGAAGFGLSYDALQQTAEAIQVREPLTYAFPLVVDGFIAYGVRALVLLREAKWTARLYTWSLFSGATSVSIWANALHAITLNQQRPAYGAFHLQSAAVGALSTLAPLGLAGATHLYIMISRHAPTVPDSELAAPEDDSEMLSAQTERIDEPGKIRSWWRTRLRRTRSDTPELHHAQALADQARLRLVSGPSGPAPASGPSGPVPASGPSGPVPASGPSGPVPVSGPSGPAPASGPSGPVPVSGPSGPAPASGSSGPVPVSGPSGPAPASGPSGPAPASGSSGPVPVSGPSGPVPVSGPSGPVPVSGPSGPVPVSGPSGPASTTGRARVKLEVLVPVARKAAARAGRTNREVVAAGLREEGYSISNERMGKLLRMIEDTDAKPPPTSPPGSARPSNSVAHHSRPTPNSLPRKRP
ncbi:DUF2637 domain-containing protein [Kitasatospora griseola]|uniref:DUF2637 domain-containing protein n=1 Tax=Kitasatospora griseola TaxID=2064 RepID=UPI0038560AED